jgi:hypothetical protein
VPRREPLVHRSFIRALPIPPPTRPLRHFSARVEHAQRNIRSFKWRGPKRMSDREVYDPLRGPAVRWGQSSRPRSVVAWHSGRIRTPLRSDCTSEGAERWSCHSAGANRWVLNLVFIHERRLTSPRTLFSRLPTLALQCRITAIAQSGARLVVTSAFGFPDTLQIRVCARTYHAKIVRRGIDHLAIASPCVLELGDTLPASLRAARWRKRLWVRDRARRTHDSCRVRL